ncbi:hypothetical protein SEPCBS119000_001014 [Sporothrix epigloea]|uniref:WIBG Mago-binding domain-containing protein n=1 Tax=Sporothrix epigloea TaxID=1892477 RepID=A0ABP0DA41_9PEZI
MPGKPTNAGIITDAAGVRHIPESTRADGSTRRAIRIRPGYQPPEDVALYRNRPAEQFRNRFKGGVPGAEPAVPSPRTLASAARPPVTAASPSPSVPGASFSTPSAMPAETSAATKNAKRREARKKADLPSDKQDEVDARESSTAAPLPVTEDPLVEREKKARGLKKKIKQAKELRSKRDGGESLLPEQIAKVIRISELVRELEALGLNAEEEPKPEATDTETKPGEGKTT